MDSIDCTVHLLTLQSSYNKDDFLQSLSDPTLLDRASYILKGRAHGWIHQPHRPAEKDYLLAQDWEYFLLTRQQELPGPLDEIVASHISADISIPKAQYDELEAHGRSKPKPMPDTPALPEEWPRGGDIPQALISTVQSAPLQPGELRLDAPIADFLKASLPAEVSNSPVSLMNFFKYPNDNSSVHDAYMEGFKNNFGNAAGATVKYMAPVKSELRYASGGPDAAIVKGKPGAWNDANLVQYDTIWHYAYMLSTDVYAGLNKQKIAGLEDTCILCVSEMELAL